MLYPFIFFGIAATALPPADVPKPRASEYAQRNTAIEGPGAAAVGRKVLGLVGADTVRVEDDWSGLSLGYDLDFFLKPTSYRGILPRCDQAVVEVYGQPEGPPPIAHGPAMFAELADSPEIHFTTSGVWRRYRRVAAAAECKDLKPTNWTVANSGSAFDMVTDALASLSAKVATGDDRSIPITCADSCKGDPYERLRAFLKADVKLVQQSNYVLTAENFRERLVMWTNSSRQIVALRLEGMPLILS